MHFLRRLRGERSARKLSELRRYSGCPAGARRSIAVPVSRIGKTRHAIGAV